MKKICKNCENYIQRRKPMTCTYDIIGYCEKDDYNIVSENYTCDKFKEKEDDNTRNI